MRFPNVLQVLFLIFVLITFHWGLNRLIIFPEYGNLRALAVSITELIVLIITILILVKQGRVSEDDVKMKRPNVTLCLISVSISILITFNPILGTISFFKEESIIKIADSVIAGPIDVCLFLHLVISAPIFEELFFRSLIFSGLKINHNVILAMILSSLLFGIFHIGIAGSIVFGLWMAWIFLKTNNVLICIIAHSTCNFVAFIFRIIAKIDQEQNIFKSIGENAFLISITMFIIAIALFYFSHKKFDSEILEKAV